MSYPITHVVVQNTPPPSHVMTIGHLYPVGPQREEVIFRTSKIDEEEEDLERWEDDGGAEEETKVIHPRRGRRPKAAEVAETK